MPHIMYIWQGAEIIIVIISIIIAISIYVSTYENGAKELNSRPKRAFFSRQKLSPKSTISKLKGKSVLFFFPLPVYLPFIALLSLLFARLHGLEKA